MLSCGRRDGADRRPLLTIKKSLVVFLAVSLTLPVNGFGQTKPLEMKWGELAPLITGHRVTLRLLDGTAVGGEAIAVRDDGILLDVSNAVKGYPKGSGTVPRNSVSLIDLQRTRGNWGRTLGTVIGVLGGIALGAYIASRNLFDKSAGQITGIFVGVAGGGALAGYFTGRAIDKRVTHIRIVP